MLTACFSNEYFKSVVEPQQARSSRVVVRMELEKASKTDKKVIHHQTAAIHHLHYPQSVRNNFYHPSQPVSPTLTQAPLSRTAPPNNTQTQFSFPPADTPTAATLTCVFSLTCARRRRCLPATPYPLSCSPLSTASGGGGEAGCRAFGSGGGVLAIFERRCRLSLQK